MTEGGGLLRAASRYYDRIFEVRLRIGLARKGDLVFFTHIVLMLTIAISGFLGQQIER